MDSSTLNDKPCSRRDCRWAWGRIATLLCPPVLAFCFAMSNPAAAEIDSLQNRLAFDAQLQQLLREACSANPALKAAGAGAAAASATAAAAKSLDPPQVGVDFYQTPISSFPDPVKRYDEIDYFLQQMVPFPGKLSARSEPERKRAEMLQADSAALAAEVARQAKEAFYELYLVDRRRDLLNENRDLLRFFEEVARKQYEVGTGKQSDILRAQTELSTVVKDSIELEQTGISDRAMVNALRAKPADSAIRPIPEIPPPFTNLTMERVGPLAEANRPELKSMTFALAMQQAGLAAAKKEYYPDFMVRGSYKQMRDAPDDWEFMVGITVPLAPWSAGKYSASTRNAKALESQAAYEFANRRNQVLSQVRDALARVQSSQAQIEIIRESIIPQARQTLQSTIAAYRTGKQDFLTLIDTRRMMLDAELEYHTAVTRLLESRAQLEQAVGVSLEEMEKK